MSILYAVSISSVFPECELPVLVEENGKATNRWADGTIGVLPEQQEAAESFFDGDHAMFDTETGEWTLDGKPLNW